MAASRASRRTARRTPRRAARARRKSASVVRSVKSVKSAVRARAISARAGAKPGLRGLVRPLLTRQPAAPPEQVLYRICKSGWAVIVEKTPNAQGTRFVCPFCTVSHRVPGPVRGFKKMRRAPWVKLRRVEE